MTRHRSELKEAWLQLYRYHHVARYQAYASLRSEIARTYVGVLWWLMEPALNGAILYVVFSQFFSNRSPDFLPYLMIGTFSYQWFASSVSIGSNSILAKSSVIQQVYIPKIIFPVVAVMNATWKFFFAFSILVLLVLIFHHPINLAYLALPAVFLVQFIFNLSIAMPLAAWIPYFREGSSVITAVLTLVMYVSGIFYQATQVPVHLRFWFEMNPVVILLSSYRSILLEGVFPNWLHLGGMAVVFLVVLAFGAMLLKRLDLSLPKVAT